VFGLARPVCRPLLSLAPPYRSWPAYRVTFHSQNLNERLDLMESLDEEGLRSAKTTCSGGQPGCIAVPMYRAVYLAIVRCSIVVRVYDEGVRGLRRWRPCTLFRPNDNAFLLLVLDCRFPGKLFLHDSLWSEVNTSLIRLLYIYTKYVETPQNASLHTIAEPFSFIHNLSH
jgi:hypothetical protein